MVKQKKEKVRWTLLLAPPRNDCVVHVDCCRANIDSIPGESLLSIMILTPCVVVTVREESVSREPNGCVSGLSRRQVFAISTELVVDSGDGAFWSLFGISWISNLDLSVAVAWADGGLLASRCIMWRDVAFAGHMEFGVVCPVDSKMIDCFCSLVISFCWRRIRWRRIFYYFLFLQEQLKDII